MARNVISKEDVEHALTFLRKYLKPGTEVYTNVSHVSSSGMTHHIQLLVPHKKEIVDLSWHAAQVLGWGMGKHGGVRVGGCGMDMGFHLVYELSGRMWPKGTRRAHGRRNGEPDKSGGYALKHRRL